MQYSERSVLVVQSDTAEQRRIESLCRTLGACVTVAGTMADAVALLHQGETIAAVLDYGCTGVPIERLLTTAAPDERCPIIVTASPEQIDSGCTELRLRRIGMAFLFVRPFRYHELSLVLGHLLRVRATTRVVKALWTA